MLITCALSEKTHINTKPERIRRVSVSESWHEHLEFSNQGGNRRSDSRFGVNNKHKIQIANVKSARQKWIYDPGWGHGNHTRAGSRPRAASCWYKASLSFNLFAPLACALPTIPSPFLTHAILLYLTTFSISPAWISAWFYHHLDQLVHLSASLLLCNPISFCLLIGHRVCHVFHGAP